MPVESIKKESLFSLYTIHIHTDILHVGKQRTPDARENVEAGALITASEKITGRALGISVKVSPKLESRPCDPVTSVLSIGPTMSLLPCDPASHYCA